MCRFVRLLKIISAGLLLTACSARLAPTISPTETTNTPIIPTETIPPAVGTGVGQFSTEMAGTPLPTPLCFTTTSTNLFAFAPNGGSLLVRTDSGVETISLKSLQQEASFQAPMNVVAAALSPDGQTLAWALEDNTIQLIRVTDSKIISTLSGHTDVVTKLKFSPSGDRLYSASHDTWVRVWDQNGEQIAAFQPTGADNLPSQVLGMGISPDGTQLATVPFDGPVKVWSLPDLKPAFELGGSGGFDTSDVAFSPDGQFIASDLATGLYLWRISDRALLLSGINTMAFAFSPDGRFLTYADIADSNKITLYSLDSLQPVSTQEEPNSPIWELLFSPDGSLLASAGVEIRIWRLADGQLVYTGKPACP